MASQVEIANRALTKLGAGRITSVTDNSKPARAISACWDTVRKAELRKRNWNFAIARASLAALGTTPAWGFQTQYQLPVDFLRLMQVNDIFVAPGQSDYRTSDDSPYCIEGTVIQTDFTAPLKIRYIRDITDPGLFDPLFVEVLASKLAYEICYEVTQSRQGVEAATNDYKVAVKDAALANAIEKPPQGLPDDSFIIGRL